MSINWNNIRPLENSQNDGFEEFVCQLARKEKITNKLKFIRKGKPDAGVECFWILGNGDEWAWQAKFFTNSLTPTQWKEIDHSVETALTKHKNLKKYIIAIPNDPPDARIEGQTSMLDKWNKRVKEWEQSARDKNMTVEFIPWWSSDIITRLQNPENVGLKYFWFNKEEFTDDWFLEQNELSIADLKKRYTPELNVELDIAKIFNGLSRDQNFKIQIGSLFDELFIKGNKSIPRVNELENESKAFSKILSEIFELFSKVNFNGIDEILTKEFIRLFDKTLETSELIYDYYIKEEELEKKSKSAYRGYYQKFGYEINNIRVFRNLLYEFKEFFEGITIKLTEHPFLLLEGEGGIGKSHLLADIVSQRNSNGLTTLFFLGQHFVTDEDPWTQIFKKESIKCNTDEFLGSLNSKAQIKGYRLLIFIDALNEGRGKYFWDKFIKSFLLKIKKYEWLGLVLSIRTPYQKLIFPINEITEKEILRHTHYGFRDQEYDAVSLFFNNYGIELPSTPLLNPEFRNPLFLRLFCEGLNKASHSKIPDGLQGITSIINFFIKNVNLVLSKPNRLDFSDSLNIVDKAVNSLTLYKIENNLPFISYEDALLEIIKIQNKFQINGNLLDELISEGIFSKNLFFKSDNSSEEGIYLAYEKFEDHIIAKALIDKYSQNLKGEFKEKGELFYLVENEHQCFVNKGIIEALSIQVPELTGKEFYEFVPHMQGCYPIIKCFVESLLWRKTETTSKKLVKYINSIVFSFQETYDLFWDTILSVTSIQNHYFNADSLHEHLMKFSMADRDAIWTKYLKYQIDHNSAVKRLIDWSWHSSDKSHISDESIRLSCITLAWFHTSTNRKLRDSSTKAMISLLENRIHILIELLKKFENVNDPYVYERLFAVAYGCALRTTQKETLVELSNYIFEVIFNKDDEIYPHILLRDYARGVIEYTSYLGFKLQFDIAIARPPYKSSFPKTYPSDSDIEKIVKQNEDESSLLNKIVYSMTTECGIKIGPYGDFGRYIFQSAFSTWNIDPNTLSNLAIKWIVEKYEYNIKKHSAYDSSISSVGRSTSVIERIGKKYQWISLYEILARVSDNFPKYEEWDFKKKNKEKYNGPWNPYTRDIDPTILIKKTGSVNIESQTTFWWFNEKYTSWEMDNKKWIATKNNIPNVKNLLKVKDDNEEDWLILQGFPEWSEPKKFGKDKWEEPHKNIWYLINSCLIADNDENTQGLINQNLLKVEREYYSSIYEVFSREFYWSDSYRDITHRTDDILENEVQDKNGNIHIYKTIMTTNGYLWESSSDHSKESAISFLKPSKYLFENMDLKFSLKEGEFVDKAKNLICFDPSVHNDSHPYLLVKMKPFYEFLKRNNLKLVWSILGEKNIIGGNHRTHYGRLEINGNFYLTVDQNIDGKLNIEIT